jgi:hypothetical protein
MFIVLAVPAIHAVLQYLRRDGVGGCDEIVHLSVHSVFVGEVAKIAEIACCGSIDHALQAAAPWADEQGV